MHSSPILPIKTLDPNRILKILTEDKQYWAQVRWPQDFALRTTKLLSMKKAILLHDIRDGIVWIGCNPQGGLFILKFPEDGISIYTEQNNVQRTYHVATLLVTLNSHHVLVMEYCEQIIKAEMS